MRLSILKRSASVQINSSASAHYTGGAYNIATDVQALITDWGVDGHITAAAKAFKSGNGVGFNISRLSVLRQGEDDFVLALFGAVTTPDRSSVEVIAGFDKNNGSSFATDSGSLRAGFTLRDDDEIDTEISLQHNFNSLLEWRESYTSADLVGKGIDLLNKLVEHAGFRAAGKINLGFTYHPDGILPKKLPSKFSLLPRLPVLPAFSWQWLDGQVDGSKDLDNLQRWFGDFLHNRLSGHTSFAWTVDNALVQADLSGCVAAGNVSTTVWGEISNLSVGRFLEVPARQFYATHDSAQVEVIVWKDNKEEVHLFVHPVNPGHQVMLKWTNRAWVMGNFHTVNTPSTWSVSADNLHATFWQSKIVSDGNASIACRWFQDSVALNAALWDHKEELLFAFNVEGSRTGDSVGLSNVVVRTNRFLFPTIEYANLHIGKAFRSVIRTHFVATVSPPICAVPPASIIKVGVLSPHCTWNWMHCRCPRIM